MKNWKFKVVKYSRDMQGKWFAHRAAGTFATFAEAKEYAEAFRVEQMASLGETQGHRICVIPRKSGGESITLPYR